MPEILSFADADSCKLHLAAHLNRNGWVSDLNTNIGTDDDEVHQLDDMSPCRTYLVPVSAGNEPLLGSDDGWNYLDFTDKAAVVLDSTESLKCLHDGSPYEINLWVQTLAEDSERVICDSCNGSGSGSASGIYLSRTAANKLNFLVFAAGSLIVNVTTDTSLLIADGRVRVRIRWTGSGSGTIRVGSEAAKTFAVGTTANVNATNNLRIGSTVAGTAGTRWRGYISDLVINNTVLTTEEQSEFDAWKPARSNADISGLRIGKTGLEFTDWRGHYMEHQYWNKNVLWKNAAKSDQVFAHDDPIRVCADPLGRSYRDAVAPSDGVRPLYKNMLINGRGAAFFNGVDSRMDYTATRSNGAWTRFSIHDLLDTTLGSHVGHQDQYWVTTHKDYPQADPSRLGHSYQVFHLVGGGGVACNAAHDDGLNVWTGRRHGASLMAECSGINRETDTNTNTFRLNSIGPEYNAGWWTHSNVRTQLMFNCALSDRDIRLIGQRLADQFNVLSNYRAPKLLANGSVIVVRSGQVLKVE